MSEVLSLFWKTMVPSALDLTACQPPVPRTEGMFVVTGAIRPPGVWLKVTIRSAVAPESRHLSLALVRARKEAGEARASGH